eukprot:7574133-Lingulodinium_polyedra.AAC.1
MVAPRWGRGRRRRCSVAVGSVALRGRVVPGIGVLLAARDRIRPICGTGVNGWGGGDRSGH